MASIQLPPAELETYLERWRQSLNIAAHNGPGVTIVSGDSQPLDDLVQVLQADGVRAQRISVGFAAHSPHIDAIRDRLLSDLAPIAPRTAPLPFYSSHIGGRLDMADLLAPYWARALRELVQFEEAVR